MNINYNFVRKNFYCYTYLVLSCRTMESLVNDGEFEMFMDSEPMVADVGAMSFDYSAYSHEIVNMASSAFDDDQFLVDIESVEEDHPEVCAENNLFEDGIPSIVEEVVEESLVQSLPDLATEEELGGQELVEEEMPNVEMVEEIAEVVELPEDEIPGIEVEVADDHLSLQGAPNIVEGIDQLPVYETLVDVDEIVQQVVSASGVEEERVIEETVTSQDQNELLHSGE